MNRYTYTSMLIGLGSAVSLLTTAPASLASDIAGPTVEPTLSAKAERSGTLRQGIPGRRLGGGTRSEGVFANDYAYLTALVTSDNVSMTAAARPTLLFYVPEMLADNQVEFILRNADDELVYESVFQVDREGGVVSVDTTDVNDMLALSIGEDYRWYFSIIPEASDRANDVVVHGAVRRIDPAEWLAQKSVDMDILMGMAPLEKARALYQRADMWHDAALLLDQLFQNNPDSAEIAAEWNQLLESAGLVTVTDTTHAAIQLGLN